MNQKTTVLIVDDEPSIRLYLKTLIKQLGSFEVETAINGKNAVDVFMGKPIHIVFMDVDMPIMNGLDAVRIMKGCKPEVPIIMLTSHCDNDTVLKAKAHGANHYFRKDLPMESLKERIEAAISTYASQSFRTTLEHDQLSQY